MSAWTALKDAWVNRDKLGDDDKTRELAAFLPAALEIQETPPNPAARKLAWSLLALVLLGILWASLGFVNIVASAEGKIIPTSRIKNIQPLEKGVVSKILVSEGDYVEQGQALIELDATQTNANKKRLEAELYSLKSRQGIDKYLLTVVAAPLKQQQAFRFESVLLDSDFDIKDSDRELFRRLVWQKWQEYWSQRQLFQRTLEKTRAEQSVARSTATKLEKTLPIVTERAKNLKKLTTKSFVSEIDYLQIEQERIQQFHDLDAERQRIRQLDAAKLEIVEQVNNLRATVSSTLLGEITSRQQQILSLEEELIKARDLDSRQVLYAPVAGRVQELAVTTIGGVVTEAQQLMLIVPDEENLQVEVFLPNKDIGFVKEGMSAEIKVHTFPFTKYGIIDAEVLNISDDAIVDEQQGLIYSMQLRMAKNTINVKGKDVRLMPGMAVTAEMQTGERRIVEFFLAPLLRYKEESIRER